MASDVESERSPEARAVAEEALFRLLVALEGEDVELVVLGGLVPRSRLLDQAPLHLGPRCAHFSQAAAAGASSPKRWTATPA